MADDSDDLVSRLDRIEELLRRRASAPASVPAGPEVRSARSIVGRIDDVWVAVTEGNERVVTAIGEMTGASRPPTPAAGPGAQNGKAPPADGPPADGPPAGAVDRAVAADLVGRVDAALAGLAEERSAVEHVSARLDRIDEQLTALADVGGAEDRLRRIEDLLTPHGAAEAEEDTAVHLRLNRIEEALAGIAGRLSDAAAGAAAGAASQPLEAEIRGLARQVEAIARAVEASAARTGDGTLTDRLGRLRDQFRPR